jgi:hypothetical protein
VARCGRAAFGRKWDGCRANALELFANLSVHRVMTTNDKVRNARTLKVQLAAVGIRARWVPLADYAAASRACRAFIEAHDLGASRWRGGRGVDAATKEVVASVSYNGRVWLPDGAEVSLAV